MSLSHDGRVVSVTSHQARCDVAAMFANLVWQEAELDMQYSMPEQPSAARRVQSAQSLNTTGSGSWNDLKTPGSYKGSLRISIPAFLQQYFSAQAFVAITVELRVDEKYKSSKPKDPLLEFDFSQWLSGVINTKIKQYVQDGVVYYFLAFTGIWNPSVLSPLFKITIYSWSSPGSGEAFFDGYINVFVESALISARTDTQSVRVTLSEDL